MCLRLIRGFISKEVLNLALARKFLRAAILYHFLKKMESRDKAETIRYVTVCSLGLSNPRCSNTLPFYMERRFSERPHLMAILPSARYLCFCHTIWDPSSPNKGLNPALEVQSLNH